MIDWLAALERLQAVQAIKTSFFAYPIINALHIVAIGALLTSVILMDLRLLGRFKDLPERSFVGLLRRVAIVAFCCAVLTGVTLFSVRATDYAEAALFFVKMGLILAAGINFAGFMMLDRHRAADAPLALAAKALAAISIAIWSAVLLAGRFLGFV